MIKIAPSILAADFARLGEEVEEIRRGGADYVHVDVMDGCFVPNISVGIPVVASLRRASDMFLDVHLMIDRPVRYVERFCKAGADLVNLHAEADSLENNLEALRIIRANGKKCGVTLKPGTPAEAVRPYLELITSSMILRASFILFSSSKLASKISFVVSIRIIPVSCSVFAGDSSGVTQVLKNFFTPFVTFLMFIFVFPPKSSN